MAFKPNTLAYFKYGTAYSLSLDLTKCSLPMVVEQLKKYHKSAGKNCPESEACLFYLKNQITAWLQTVYDDHEPMAPEHVKLYEDYTKQAQLIAQRMFCYLLFICTRESRHGNYKTEPFASKGTEFLKNFSENLSGSGGAIDYLLANPPSTSLGVYTDYLTDAFYKASYSSGFGGKAWGGIADVLNKFVTGEITAELMVDTSFALCHNNGPIFNKGMVFAGYQSQDSIIRVLDVQRAGRMSNYLTVYHKDYSHCKEAYNYLSKVADVLPDEFFDPIDWQEVEDLGSVNKYTSFKAGQASKSASVKKPAKAKSQKVSAAPSDKFFVTPNLKLKIVKTERKK